MSHHNSTIRKLCEETKDKFQALHDAVRGPAAARTGTTESKPERRAAAGNARFDANEFICAKCSTAIGLLDASHSATRGEHSKDQLEKLVHHLNSLFREILVAYRGAGIDKHNQQLEDVHGALRRLSWAEEGENRLALVEICESVKNLKEVFSEVETSLKNEKRPLWPSQMALARTAKGPGGRPAKGKEPEASDESIDEDAHGHDGDATSVAGELCALCDECEHGATAAIDAICDSAKLQALMDNVCRLLTDMQKRHDYLRCVLHLRGCQPDMQPTETAALLASLEQSGAEMARLIRAGHRLNVKQRDIGCELRESWQSLRECMEHLREDLVNWGDCQCAAPEGCLKGVDGLIALAAQGSKLVESAGSKPICCETLFGVCQLAEQFDDALRQFECQLEKLDDFPHESIGCCWWKLVRIQLICQCPPADDCCSELKTEVTRLMEQFQHNKPESPAELMKAVNVGRLLQLAMECFGRAARGECVDVCAHQGSGSSGKKEAPGIAFSQATSQTKLAQYWVKSDELCQRMAQCPELSGFAKQWGKLTTEQAMFLEAYGQSLPGAIEMSQARRQSFITAGSTALRLIEASVPAGRRDSITKLRLQFDEQNRVASV